MAMTDGIRPGAILDDKYRIERILGWGGMGMVVSARHLAMGHLVAIKFMRSKAMAFADNVKRFLREAAAVARLRSDNIALVYDVGTMSDGAPYIVMQYLKGIDLASALEQHGPIPWPLVAEYGRQACNAMSEAHANDIIHRDLKPSNLYLTSAVRGRPLIKVLDFGISKYRPQNNSLTLTQTRSHDTMGSPPYMSPEQVKSAKYVDARSDIWSLGVCLFQLVSGRFPFSAQSTAEMFAEILRKPPRTFEDVEILVPPDFQVIVSRCLSKEPSERYQSVEELGEVLSELAERDPDSHEPLLSLHAPAPSRPSLVERMLGHAAVGNMALAPTQSGAEDTSFGDVVGGFEDTVPIGDLGLGDVNVALLPTALSSGDQPAPDRPRRARSQRSRRSPESASSTAESKAMDTRQGRRLWAPLMLVAMAVLLAAVVLFMRNRASGSADSGGESAHTSAAPASLTDTTGADREPPPETLPETLTTERVEAMAPDTDGSPPGAESEPAATDASEPGVTDPPADSESEPVGAADTSEDVVASEPARSRKRSRKKRRRARQKTKKKPVSAPPKDIFNTIE